MIGRFKSGVLSFFEGFGVLKRDPNFRLLGAIPALMSLTLYTLGLVLGVLYLEEILNWIIKINIGEYNAFIKSLIYILSVILIGIALYFLTFLVVSILSIPVCTSLSHRVMVQTGYLLPSEKSLKENLFTFIRMLRISLLKLIFILLISGLLFIASLIPVVAPVALFLSVMILAFDCMDYAMEHDEQGLRQRLKFLFVNIPEFAGFAACMAVILLIPFVHFILLPTAVVGTSILYTKIQTTKKLKEGYDSKTNS